MTIAALDIGKSHVKIVVLDDHGQAVASYSRQNAVLDDPPFPHFDTNEIERWIVETLALVPNRAEIDAIVPVAHGCAAALIAADTLALPFLDYEYAGPDEIAAEYDRAADPFDHTFTPPLPLGLLVGRQLWWLARRFPEEFARTTAILPNPQFWAWRLCGTQASEVTSLGSHTGLWAPRARRFSDLVAREGWLAKMPPLSQAWDTLGPLRPAIVAATGLSPDCRVLCGVHDSNASFLAHRATREPPFTVISTGTWTIVMAAGAALDRLDPSRDMLANVDVFGDPVPTARFMGGREFAAAAGNAAGQHPTLAEAAAVIARGSRFVPAFVPGSGPFAGRRGALLGPAPETQAEHAALASVYIALVVDVMLDLLGAHPPFIVEGPSASDSVFLTVLAGLRPDARVVASQDGTGTSAGAAILAGWGRSPPRISTGRVVPAAPDALPGLLAYRASWRADINEA